MLRRYCRSIHRVLHGVLYPENERVTADLIRRFELCMGLRPFRLIYPQDTNDVIDDDNGVDNNNDDTSNTPSLVLSTLGLSFCIGHLTVFLLSGIAIELLNPHGALAISDDALAYTEVDITAWLHVFNALSIFVQSFVHRHFECDEAQLHRRFSRHLRALGVDVTQAHRSTGAVMLLGLALVLVTIVSQYYVGVLFLERTVDPGEQQYLWVFSVAVVMPILYIELVIVQFAMKIEFLRIRVRLLNDLLHVLVQYINRMPKPRADGKIEAESHLDYY